jgi:hypothetical protein
MIQQKAGQIYNTVIKMLWSMHVEQQEETKTHRTKSQSSNVCVCWRELSKVCHLAWHRAPAFENLLLADGDVGSSLDMFG